MSRAHPVAIRNPGAVVADDQANTVGQPFHTQVDTSPGRNILQTILDEVGYELGQELPVALDDRATVLLVDESESGKVLAVMNVPYFILSTAVPNGSRDSR